MARQSRTYKPSDSYPHREHRSKKGRRPYARKKRALRVMLDERLNKIEKHYGSR